MKNTTLVKKPLASHFKFLPAGIVPPSLPVEIEFYNGYVYLYTPSLLLDKSLISPSPRSQELIGEARENLYVPRVRSDFMYHENQSRFGDVNVGTVS